MSSSAIGQGVPTLEGVVGLGEGSAVGAKGLVARTSNYRWCSSAGVGVSIEGDGERGWSYCSPFGVISQL